MKKLLVLFDIDGTLTNRVGNLKESLWRFPYAVKKLFNVDLNLTVDDYMSFNGWIDKAQEWEMVKTKGVSREEYEKKFPKFGEIVLEYFKFHKPTYTTAPGAKELLQNLYERGVNLGVITGNVEEGAWWKLDNVGIRNYFSFGLFGGEANDRVELASYVFEKAKRHFGTAFLPDNIVIIGDTVHDVRSAKENGLKSILILTGGQNSEVPKDVTPNLIVSSLEDKKV